MKPTRTQDTPIAESKGKPVRPIDTGRIIPHKGLRKLYRPIQPLVEAIFGFPALWKLHQAAVQPGTDALGVAEGCLRELNVTWSMPDREIELLRAVEGPLIVMSNHPFGGVDSFAIIALLEDIRPKGWKTLSNELLAAIEGIGPHVLPVDPIGENPEVTRANRSSIRNAYASLNRGGTLLFFAAGRVSMWSKELNAICDRTWSEHGLRLGQKAGASCVVLHIPGQNSKRFLRVPPAWSRFRAMMLCHEITQPPCKTVELRIAALYGPDELRRIGEGPLGAQRLRASCYHRADLDVPRPVARDTVRALPPLDDAKPHEELRAEVTRLSDEGMLLTHNSSFDLLFVRGDEAPALLHELGRAREITFRHAGQGSGKGLDLSPEDDYYHHLILWDRAQGKLAGSYRVGIVQEILEDRGAAALYLGHVFEIDSQFYYHLGPAFELSRSFVLPEYQKDNGALSGLWKGLGAASIKYKVGTLFGSVTISNDHHPASRAVLVEHLKRNYSDDETMCDLIRARQPFEPVTTYHSMAAAAYEGESIDALAPLINRAENGERGIPPLMKYYCTLGARYLGYHVEAEFQDALYCLLRVKLDNIPKGYRKRFMGM
jgi:putative hemolysin